MEVYFLREIKYLFFSFLLFSYPKTVTSICLMLQCGHMAWFKTSCRSEEKEEKCCLIKAYFNFQDSKVWGTSKKNKTQNI